MAEVDGEILVMGGVDFQDSCPESGGCDVRPTTPFADGAAYDIASSRWRMIEPAPIGIWRGQTVTIGTSVYMLAWTATNEPAFLRYRIDEDRWDEITWPGFDQLRPMGNTVVAYQSVSDLQPRLWVLAPERDSWVELPADPLGPSTSRSVLWSGRYLYLFGSRLSAAPSERSPTFAVARFDPVSWTWRSLPNSDFVGAASWFVDGTRAVNPAAGCQDDAPNGQPGICYPLGGIFEFGDETWHELPTDGAPAGGTSVGVIGHAASQYGAVTPDNAAAAIPILDLATDEWRLLPWLDDPDDARRQIVAIGLDAFVFGGQSYGDGQSTPLDDAWILHLHRKTSTRAPDSIDIVELLATRQ